MQLNPFVSVIISSYNYAHFLSEAIESVLMQTYAHIEVIVVDDGSKDHSRDIIATFGDRIIPILKENGGQASAWNRGFAIAKGEIIIFLDSDDALMPHIVQQVVEVFQAHPTAAKVQYRLQVVDGSGQPTGDVMPAKHCKLPNGDIRSQVLKFPNYYWPTSSGNAFSTQVLKALMPIPEAPYRVSPDIYLNHLIALLGSIYSLEQPGGLLRKHGNNASAYNQIDMIEFRRNLINTAKLHEKRREIAKLNSKTLENRDIRFLVGRMVSLKLEPEKHPFSDHLFLLCCNGVITCLTDPEGYAYQKIFLTSWFTMMFFVPRSMALSLSNNLIFSGSRKPWMKKLFYTVRRIWKLEAQA
ncbi:MAG: glycosyltransferase [Stenomitos rutilans HA7619-LM2]|jgi:glycosyltransferase involved in cell wall biosynthesis|nr:glycosyltransferase [Stenomitos rutilans HA7619-LM2]